jgi:Arc/MetJ family transcription regulator
MRTTLNLDDDLLLKAQQMSGLTERSQVIREALTALVQRESARRLAKLGGTESLLKTTSRRQSTP